MQLKSRSSKAYATEVMRGKEDAPQGMRDTAEKAGKDLAHPIHAASQKLERRLDEFRSERRLVSVQR